MQIFQDFLSLIFPNICFICNDALAKGEDYICTSCRYKLPKTNFHKSPSNPLPQRFYGIIEIKHVYSYLYFIKNGSASRLLNKLKYENFPDLGSLLGRWYAKDLQEIGLGNEYDIILAVPLHSSKFRKRGYNQSDGIAKGLSEVLEIPFVDNILLRVHKNESQTRKGRIERWKNVENIFQVRDPDFVKGKRILLVDDVLTTGATIEACATAIHEAGCAEIGIVTLAVAQ